jgi:hypothetical protein
LGLRWNRAVPVVTRNISSWLGWESKWRNYDTVVFWIISWLTRGYFENMESSLRRRIVVEETPRQLVLTETPLGCLLFGRLSELLTIHEMKTPRAHLQEVLARNSAPLIVS